MAEGYVSSAHVYSFSPTDAGFGNQLSWACYRFHALPIHSSSQPHEWTMTWSEKLRQGWYWVKCKLSFNLRVKFLS